MFPLRSFTPQLAVPAHRLMTRVTFARVLHTFAPKCAEDQGGWFQNTAGLVIAKRLPGSTLPYLREP
jgi:hypothetical protein